jgi:hypothetical protein
VFGPNVRYMPPLENQSSFYTLRNHPKWPIWTPINEFHGYYSPHNLNVFRKLIFMDTLVEHVHVGNRCLYGILLRNYTNSSIAYMKFKFYVFFQFYYESTCIIG